MSEPAITQKHRVAKRALLAPIAPLARRWALAGTPSTRKAMILRHVVVPALAAAGKDYEREVPAGFRFAGNGRDLLGLMVNLFGVWEPNLSALIQHRLGPGDTFIDVGANSGWFTTMGATCVGPSGHVVAVEASPLIAGTLRQNLARNGIENVRVLVAAVASEPGFADVMLGPAEHTGLTRVQKASEASRTGTQVPADTLTRLLRDDEIASARLVKIDVEGAEYDVVAGLAPELGRFSEGCEFVVEVGPERAKSSTDVESLISTFTDVGYTPYFLPNFYDIRSYLLEPVAVELDRLMKAPTAEVDIVFSRRGGETLPI